MLIPEHARLSRHVTPHCISLSPSRRYHIIGQTITLSIELHLSSSASLLTSTGMIDNGVKIVSHKQSPEMLIPEHARLSRHVTPHCISLFPSSIPHNLTDHHLVDRTPPLIFRFAADSSTNPIPSFAPRHSSPFTPRRISLFPSRRYHII
jgi:hypothetical protein